MTSIDRANAAARQRAQQAGHGTYSQQVVDAWPACVDCDRPIRHRPSAGHRDRSCGCDGVQWRCGLDGWHRVGP